MKLSVAAKQFPAKALTDVLGHKDFVVDAPIDFAADLSGTGDDLQADVSAQLGSGTANGISFTGAYALFNIRNGLITLQQASGSRAPIRSAHTVPFPSAPCLAARPANPWTFRCSSITPASMS